MMKQDYILRVIEEFGQAWALVVARLRAGRYAEALEGVDEAAHRHLGLSLSLIDGMSSEGLLDLMRVGHSLDRGRCVLLAELLREQGEILELQGRPAEATVARAKALDIFLEIYDAYDAPELAERLAAMERMIGRWCAQDRVGSSSWRTPSLNPATNTRPVEWSTATELGWRTVG
jgi:hypothetical protein